MTPGNAPCRPAGGRRRAAGAPGPTPVLTHLIEGFVIQEGATPFSVGGGSQLWLEGSEALVKGHHKVSLCVCVCMSRWNVPLSL